MLQLVLHALVCKLKSSLFMLQLFMLTVNRVCTYVYCTYIHFHVHTYIHTYIYISICEYPVVMHEECICAGYHTTVL